MEDLFEAIISTRQNVLKLLDNCTEQQLYEIPKGFNNNIMWNAAHLLSTQQLLVYGLTKTPFHVKQEIIEGFRGGTKPTSSEALPEVLEYTKVNLIPTIELLRTDYNGNKFGEIRAINTRYGFGVDTVEKAIMFVNIHEAMHFGQMRSMKWILS